MNQALAILAALSIVAGGGFLLGMEVKQGQWDASIVASREAQDKALDAAAKAIAQIDIKQQTIVQRVTHETVEKPVYRDCVNDPGVMRDINAAIQSAGSGELSDSSPAD